jgi:glycine oxidase
MSWDVVIIGAGIMGSTSALALARRGARVLVLEKSVPGAEASSAAAGILGAQIEAHEQGPEVDLFLRSRDLYAAWTEHLVSTTGIDVGYRRCGSMRLFPSDADAEQGARGSGWQERAGLAVERLDHAALRAREPAVSERFVAAERFPDDAQVEPPKLLRALSVAALGAGVSYRSGTSVRGVAIEGGRAVGVDLEDGTRIEGGHVVLAAGSWSTLVAGVPLAPGAVKPARGQIVELTLRAPLFGPVIFGAGAYLVPRADGRVLIGSTLEFVGFQRDVTARGVRDLLVAATAIVPALEEASFSGTWSSFRPFAMGPPLIGPSSVRGLVLATGHHRNGILLAPVTGELVAEAVMSR